MSRSHRQLVGGKPSPTYNSWQCMKKRCLNPKATKYHRYGGRGVQVCERWLTFENFLADMGERPEGTTLGRHGDKGDYEPGNCSWQTVAEQVVPRNRRSQAKLTDEQVACAASLWIFGKGGGCTHNGPSIGNMARDLQVHPETLREAIHSYFAACETAVADSEQPV